MPNVVPVSMKQVIDDETVMVSDQYLNKTLANLRANPRAALSVWDEETGFQVTDHERKFYGVCRKCREQEK